MNEQSFVDQQIDAHTNTTLTEDPRYLPQPHMVVPSQNNVVHERRDSLHGGESPPHPVRQSVSPDSLLLRDEGRSVAHQPNKRPHPSEEIVRHYHTTSGPATWSVPGESVMKVSAARKTVSRRSKFWLAHSVEKER